MCQAAALQAKFTQSLLQVPYCSLAAQLMPVSVTHTCAVFSAAGVLRLPQAFRPELIGCLQGMKESLRVSKCRTHPQGRQSTGSTLQLASLQTGQGSWSQTCCMPCMRPGHLTLSPGEGLQPKPRASGNTGYRRLTRNLKRAVQGSVRKAGSAPASVV